MYERFRLVPWSDFEEFKKVAAAVCSGDDEDLHVALSVMYTWCNRVAITKIPRSILCTYELLVAKFECSGQSLAYALMRFVSLVSSEEQDKDRPTYAAPVLSLTRKVGLPCWMADLRNDVAHGVVPSFAFLYAAFDWAMDWLRNFWKLNLREGDPANSLSLESTKVISIFTSSLCPREKGGDAVDRLTTRMLESTDSSIYRRMIHEVILDLHNTHFHSDNQNIIAELLDSSMLGSFFSLLGSKGVLHLFILQFFLSLNGVEDRKQLFLQQWCACWTQAFTGAGSLRDFIDEKTVKFFNWRRCLLHLIDVLSEDIYPMFQKLVHIYQPSISQSKQENILNLVELFLYNATFTGHLVNANRCKHFWLKERLHRWCDVPLGATICPHIHQDAPTSRLHKGVYSEDPTCRCEVGQN